MAIDSKILIAGAGHGGLATAILLARIGMDVTIFERGARGELGYDWGDVFTISVLKQIGIPVPPKRKYQMADDITFCSPNGESSLTQHSPRRGASVKMERRTLYKWLIKYARRSGVNIIYNCGVHGPLMSGSRVIGLDTDDGKFYGDLVIDAAGLDSPVRRKLPERLGIENTEGRGARFNVYRAYYNKLDDFVASEPYRVYLFPGGESGIDWVVDEKRAVDVLIGRFDVLTARDVKVTLRNLRQVNPGIGHEIVRGGQFVSIPVRQPMGVLVADGYAAIGDSAFMTMPLIGSGIANSLRAAKILANTVIADKRGDYTAASLWSYQVGFYKELGVGLANLACVRGLLLRLTPGEVDYAFSHGILTAEDLTIGVSDGVKLSEIARGVTLAGAANKVKGLRGNKGLQNKIIATAARLAKVSAVMAAMPREWNQKAVSDWAKRYAECFR